RHVPLVPVPGHVGFDGVAAGVLDLLEAVAPERLRAAEVVEGPAEDRGVLAVDRQAAAVVADAVGMREVAGDGIGPQRQGGGEEEEREGAAHGSAGKMML